MTIKNPPCCSCSSRALDNFPARAVRGLAATQIVFGCLVIIAQVVVLAVYSLFFNHISQGIWCGIAFVVCGAFGVVSARKRTLPWVVTHLTLCIIVCLFCAAIITLSALTAVYYFGSMYTYQSRPCPGNNGFPMFYGTGSSGTGYYYSPSGDTGGYPDDDFWGRFYNSMGFDSPNQYYAGYGGEPCFGHYVINIPWIVQFSMNLLMGFLGIMTAIVSIVAATLSCAPICYYRASKHDDSKDNLIDDTTGSDIVTITPPSYCEKPPIYGIQVEGGAVGATMNI